MENRANDKNTPTFAFEQVAAKLVPFDLSSIGAAAARGGSVITPKPPGLDQGKQSSTDGLTSLIRDMRSAATSNTTEKNDRNHALWPIFKTNGLIFPYNPTISENVSVNYDTVELTHTNESYHNYKNTSNVRINLGNAVWTCDTFDNAIYALSALHFFRAYSQMDFGSNKSGRPPSPMWFSAYGSYAFHRVPVLMEKADWSFPNDVDYVGIPEPGTPEYINRQIQDRKSAASGNSYTWLPIKFEVSSISLIVQHSPRYWLNFNLDDYRSGAMLRNRGSFHTR